VALSVLRDALITSQGAAHHRIVTTATPANKDLMLCELG
jgi:hypothetical protein